MASYPLRLIPTPQLQIISSANLDTNHYIGRAIEANVRLKDNDGKLNLGAIEVNRIPGFSTNKLPKSKKQDLNIKFKKEFIDKYTANWIEGENGLPPPSHTFNIDYSRQHYFIKISQINGFTDNYKIPSNKKNIPDFSAPFEVFVCHKPTVSNYWHFEFKVMANGEEIKSIDSKAWRKLICSSISDRIQEVALFRVND